MAAEHPAAMPCHVYCVSQPDLPFDKLMEVGYEACHVCGQRLDGHVWETSGLIPDDKVFVIDEKALHV